MSERDSRDLKVLLVEDVEDTRLFMRLALEDQGFIVLKLKTDRPPLRAPCATHLT